MLMCAILYRGLGHLWVLGTGVGVLEPSPSDTRDSLKFGAVRSYARFFFGGGGQHP